MAALFFGGKSVDIILNECFNIKKLNDKDIIFIIENFANKDQIEQNKEIFIISVCKNELVLQQMEKLKYITKEDIKKNIYGEDLIKILNSGATHILKYVKPEECTYAYKRGIIDEKELSKHTKIEDIFHSQYLNKEDIMKVLEKKVYQREASETIWKLYESNFFSTEDVYKLNNLGYIMPTVIIKKYLEEHERKISLELKDKLDISDKKMIEYFNANQVLNLANECKNDKILKFFKTELKNIYGQFNRDLERELINAEKENNEKQEKKKSLLDLYTEGLVSLSKFTKDEVSEEDILYLYTNSNLDENILIQAYNVGLISQESVLENIAEIDYIYKLIKENKLNASVLDTYCDTAELIKLYQSEQLTLDNLSSLKSNIKIEEIRRLYNDNKLEYVELSELADHGVIDKKDADEIKDSYDVEADLELLRKKGEDFCSVIFTKDVKRAYYFLENVNSQTIYINKNPFKNYSFFIDDKELIKDKRIII